MKFIKYHALGNDYIVIDPVDMEDDLTASQIRSICHRNFGVGSDGILLGPITDTKADFGVRIFNPDGSEAEKSGNGLRIFSRYLFDRNLVNDKPFTIWTIGGTVTSQVHPSEGTVTVDMGQVGFDSQKIPVAGPPREVINETVDAGERQFIFCAATIGNPHCVIVQDQISPEETRQFGPALETHSLFPNRINVQFMRVISRNAIQIEIWERGAGYTLASGSSSCAAAAVAYKLGLCDDRIDIHMPGGQIDVTLSADFFVRMTGPVTRIAEGFISEEAFDYK